MKLTNLLNRVNMHIPVDVTAAMKPDAIITCVPLKEVQNITAASLDANAVCGNNLSC